MSAFILNQPPLLGSGRVTLSTWGRYRQDWPVDPSATELVSKPNVLAPRARKVIAQANGLGCQQVISRALKGRKDQLKGTIWACLKRSKS